MFSTAVLGAEALEVDVVGGRAGSPLQVDNLDGKIFPAGSCVRDPVRGRTCGRSRAQKGVVSFALETLFGPSPNLLCLSHAGGYLVELSPAWERTLGWTPEELKSVPHLAFVHPEDVSRTTRANEELAAGRSVRDLRNRYRCRDGSYRWLLWRAVPKGSFQFCVARDILGSSTQGLAVRLSDVMSFCAAITRVHLPTEARDYNLLIHAAAERTLQVAERLAHQELSDAQSSPPEAAARAIDLRTALRRLAGNEALLRQRLQEFAEDHEHTVDAISDYLAVGHRAEAADHAHTLAAASARLNAMETARLARQVELRLRKALPCLDELRRLGDSLGRVLDEIADYARNGHSGFEPD